MKLQRSTHEASILTSNGRLPTGSPTEKRSAAGLHHRRSAWPAPRRLAVRETARGNAGPRGGFSLLEMIAVLAVVLILATIIFSATTSNLTVAFAKQENAQLQAFATALQNNVLRSRYIPGTTGTNVWYQAIASELGVTTNTVLYNLPNARSPRVLMVDPTCAVGPNGGGLPYSQGVAGSVYPSNVRVMIVSSLRPNTALPAAGTDPTNFANVWGTVVGALPSTGFTGWNPYDLAIQRVNLAPLFVQLQLENYQSSDQGQYTIDTSSPAQVPPTNGLQAYYLQGTVLGLITGTNSGNATNAMLVMNRDSTYFYVAQSWQNTPFAANNYAPASVAANMVSVNLNNNEALNLAQMVSLSATIFASSPYNNHSSAGATPPSVVNAISNYMYCYIPYAAYGNTNNWPTSGTLYQQAAAAQTALGNALNNLLNGIAEGGCTNGVSP